MVLFRLTDSDLGPTCAHSLGRGGLNKRTMAPTSTSVWERVASLALTLKSYSLISPHISLVLFELLFLAGAQGKCLWANEFSHRAFKRISGFLATSLSPRWKSH